MCSITVLCPLCHHTSFSSIDALRCSLIKAANGPLSCPICHELFLGLDKLTIHLFSHTNIMNANDSPKQTETIPANNNNNSSNNHSQISNHNNNDKLKTEENLSAAREEVSTTLSNTTAKQQNIINEVNFENTHQSQQQQPLLRTAVKKCKISKNEQQKKINKKSQVAGGAGSSHDLPNARASEAPAIADNIDSLATCDICEFTFRNDELRDMHVRLVHQNFVYSSPIDSAKANSPIDNAKATECHNQTEPDFKCHLCSKTFKMKGSLRVHLKVVHLMGLPYVNNTPKLNICDRIRHKESKQLKSSAPLNESDDMASAAHNNVYNIQPIALIPTVGTALDASTTSLANLSVLNISPSNEFVSTAIGDSTKTLQNSNLLLVFNNNSNNTRNISHSQANLNTNHNNNNCADNPTNANSSTTSTSATTNTNNTSLSNDNPKIWECDVCSKAFTTKYFLKKHKRLHTGDLFFDT